MGKAVQVPGEVFSGATGRHPRTHGRYIGVYVRRSIRGSVKSSIGLTTKEDKNLHQYMTNK